MLKIVEVLDYSLTFGKVNLYPFHFKIFISKSFEYKFSLMILKNNL